MFSLNIPFHHDVVLVPPIGCRCALWAKLPPTCVCCLYACTAVKQGRPSEASRWTMRTWSTCTSGKSSLPFWRGAIHVHAYTFMWCNGVGWGEGTGGWSPLCVWMSGFHLPFLLFVIGHWRWQLYQVQTSSKFASKHGLSQMWHIMLCCLAALPGVFLSWNMWSQNGWVVQGFMRRAVSSGGAAEAGASGNNWEKHHFYIYS